MTHPLRGIAAKLNRAHEHLGLINQWMFEVINGETYRVSTAQDPFTNDVTLFGEVLGEPPVEDWGALIGDITHNLRSALDHLVWQLGLMNSDAGAPPAEPIPRNSPWKGSAFPIVYDETNWGSQAGQKLSRIRPALHARFKALQPFVTGPAAPREEPLGVLEALWNIDKHRHLHLVTVSGAFESAVVTFEGFPQAKAQVIAKRAPGPLRGRTELVKFRIVDPPTTGCNMSVDHIVAFDIAFPEGPPANGRRAGTVLESMYDAVVAVVAEFEPQFPQATPADFDGMRRRYEFGDRPDGLRDIGVQYSPERAPRSL